MLKRVMNMKKKCTLFILIFFITGMLVCMALETYHLMTHQGSLYRDHWHITLPEGLTSIYKTHSELGFQNDGVYYEVFDVKNPSLLAKTFDLSHFGDDKFEQTFLDISYEFSIPSSYYPHFDQCTYQIFKSDYGYDEMYVIYDQKYLYILQNIF